MSAINDVKGMANGLQSSIDSAMKRLQSQQTSQNNDQAAASADVQSYQQDTRKSAYNFAPFATNMGVLIKDTSRLNVMSQLAGNDPADFYKVQIATDGNVTLGQVGDKGIRLQLMDKTGNVLADSEPDSGDAYAAYKKLQTGDFAATKGDYTVRVSRAKGENPTTSKDYAFQLLQGTYTKDYDTIARQPDSNTGKATSYLDVLRQGGASNSMLNSMLPGSGALGMVDSNSALSLLNGSNTGRGSLVNMLF